MVFYEKIKIFYDGYDINNFNKLSYIKGYTTNPSILNKCNSSLKNYEDLAKSFLKLTNNNPVSFEVFADNDDEMIKQARIISSWDENIYVKIPIINTKGDHTSNVIKQLNSENIKLNITAIFTNEQVDIANENLSNKNVPTIISIFSGRIADTGINPKKCISYAVESCKNYNNIEILWASTREVYNLFDAIECNCDIITVPDSVLNKFNDIGKDLNEYSLATVKTFYKDGLNSNIII